MMKQKSQSKSEKRVLIASLSLAAVVMAGATFAWFTSQDQVTNRLSAEADYAVAITESFVPPTDWTPGQEINKDVKAINTGNIDALVKLSFDHSFTVTGKGDSIAVADAAAADLAEEKAVEITEGAAKAMQAGGYVIYNKNQIEENPREASEDPFDEDGLYIFRRVIKKTADGDNKLTATEYEYSGYYVKGGKYYQVEFEDGAVTLDADTLEVTAVDQTKITIPTIGDSYVYTYSDDADDSVTWEFVDALDAEGAATTYANAAGIRITYAGQDASATDDDIVVYAAFDDAAKTNYAYNTADESFYYNYVLAAGEETKSALITSVTLGAETQESAYTALDYDLDVMLNSIQASVDESRAYTAETAESWLAGSTVTGTQDAANGAVTWAVS